MKFYDDTKPLYLETDTSKVDLGAALLQTWEDTTCQKDMVPDNTILHPIAFASKSLTGVEHRYSNIERESLGILHGLKIFHHYCFTGEVHIIADHKPLVTIIKKDVATLSQSIQHILLKIHQYKVQILYKPGPQIFIADWLSHHNHKEGNDEPIQDMDIRVDAIQSTTGIPQCMSILQIQQTMAQDEHLQGLKYIIITGWPNTKNQLHIHIRPYWCYKDNLAVIGGVVMNGRYIIEPQDLKQQVLDQLPC